MDDFVIPRRFWDFSVRLLVGGMLARWNDLRKIVEGGRDKESKVKTKKSTALTNQSRVGFSCYRLMGLHIFRGRG